MLKAIWHEVKNVEGVSQFLRNKKISFTTSPSPLGHDHIAFSVESDSCNVRRLADQIADKFGRFALERQEIELTADESLAVETARQERNMELKRLEESRNLRNQKISELLNDTSIDEPEEPENEENDEESDEGEWS